MRHYKLKGIGGSEAFWNGDIESFKDGFSFVRYVCHNLAMHITYYKAHFLNATK